MVLGVNVGIYGSPTERLGFEWMNVSQSVPRSKNWMRNTSSFGKELDAAATAIGSWKKWDHFRNGSQLVCLDSPYNGGP